MYRFSAHLALIAYLVGGWLLPAAHHHGLGHGQSGGNCVCSPVGCATSDSPLETDAVWLVSTPPVSTPYQHGLVCSCEHSTDAPVRFAKARSELIPGQHAAEDCGGLCALCCAVSLVGQLSADSATSFAIRSASDERPAAGLAWPLPLPDGGICSRGPPVV